MMEVKIKEKIYFWVRRHDFIDTKDFLATVFILGFTIFLVCVAWFLIALCFSNMSLS